jgi:glutamate synthase (NADPH) large chain
MGLYDPAYEHDGCGVACLARLDGRPAHETISRAIQTLDNLEHRGAEGADAETGDGAGILTQIPDAFLRAAVDFALPPAGEYAVAVCFLPREADRRSACETVIERLVEDGAQRVLGWRDVPVDEAVSATPAPARAITRRSSSRCPRTSCASRGGAAWTAASRSAIRAARSAT